MANDTLTSLLNEYAQKKLHAELDLEKRKNALYELIPRLQEIDDELNNLGIETTKNILNNSSDEDSINFLKLKIKDLKREKEEILLKNNYPSNYLKPFYECTKCNDTGYITDSNYHTYMCSCLKQRLIDSSFNNSNISSLKKENFENFNELIFSDEVDVAKYKYNISPRKNIINIKNNCINFINNFDDPNSKNLLFTGYTGLRKNIYV